MKKNLLAFLCFSILATLPACWCCKPKCKKERNCETRIVYKPECETRCHNVTEMVPQCVDEVVTETVMVPQCRDKVIKKTVMVPHCKEVCHEVEVMVPHEQKVYTTVETTGCKPCKPKKTCKPRCKKTCKPKCKKTCKPRCKTNRCGTNSVASTEGIYAEPVGEVVVMDELDNNGYTGYRQENGVVSNAVSGATNTVNSAVGTGAGVVRDIL